MKKTLEGILTYKEGYEWGPTLYLDEEPLWFLLDDFMDKEIKITVSTKRREE